MCLSVFGKHSTTIEIGEEHDPACLGNAKLHLLQWHGHGFEITDKYLCNFYKQECTIKSGPEDDPNAKKSRRGQASASSKIITHVAHGDAMNHKQIGEFCDHNRMIRPSDRGLRKIHRKRKDAVKIVSRE